MISHATHQVVSAARRAAKAIYAAVTAAITGLILVTIDGGTISGISVNQWLVIALSVVVAGGGVYGLTNKTT